MFVFLMTILHFGCKNEEPYDLSQIPIKESNDDKNLQVQVTKANDEMPIQDVGSSCIPPGQTTLSGESSNTILVSLNTPPDTVGKPVLVDFILPTYGEVQYSIVCKGSELHFPVPRMLGKVSVAVFVDETEDGPSATDPQGLIEGVEIATDNIDLGTIELNASLGTLYQFEKENDKRTSPMPEIPPGEKNP